MIKGEKAILNTTISRSALDEFRKQCQKINCPMNTVLEMFMRQFADGQFTIQIGKTKQLVDTTVDTTKED